jgi:glycosyltransferase involved in cell wall biosynthesis
MNNMIKQTKLALGNKALRESRFEDAVTNYEATLEDSGPLRKYIIFNINLAKKRIGLDLGSHDTNEVGRSECNDQTDVGLIKLNERVLDQAELIRPQFDHDYYIANNHDVVQAGIDPVVHYCQSGYLEGRNPHPEFSTSFYLTSNPDVASSGENPFLHYLTFGKPEGRVSREMPWMKSRSFSQPTLSHYDKWIEVNKPSDTEEHRIHELVKKTIGYLPLISVIMPVFRPPIDLLEEAINSVLDQIYSKWELCIHVDGDDDIFLHNWLRALANRDNRIKLSLGKINNGISFATNAAVDIAKGDFLAFFDQDDLLNKTALAKIAIAISRTPDVDILYTDDDKIDANGKRYAPQFKPDWAPTLLLSYMYLSHLLVVRRSLFNEIGGFRKGYEGSQDFDFALRVSEKARSVYHLPDVLYHWRAIAGSTAVSGDAKPNSFIAGLRAVQEACERREIPAQAIQPNWAIKAKVGIFSLVFRDTGPKVSIIIPTKNRLDLLAPCISSIEMKTKYKNYEIIIVDNDSDDPATIEYLNGTNHKVLMIKSPGGKFSFAHLMNVAVKSASGQYVLLLNNDTVVMSDNWLSQMVGYAQMPGIGAVGAKLYFPDETIQHAGIIHGLYGDLAGPAFRNLPSYSHGYLGYTMVAREFSAVTAACLLTKKDIFQSINGMDEIHFAVAYNDVDYCYRLIAAGHRIIYCPEAELTHFEGKSRGFSDNKLELANFRHRYRNYSDPWYNQNLTRENESFEVRPCKYVDRDCLQEPIRIAMFSHNLNHEGAPNSMFELVKGLSSKSNFVPVIIAPDDGPLQKFYDDAGIKVEFINHPLLNGFDPSVYHARVEHIANVLRLSGTELVYANTAESFWVIDIARRAGIPAVWNIRESEPWQSYYQNLPDFLQEIAFEAFHYPYRVIFVAYSTCELWKPLNGGNNFTVIQNGLDLTRIRQRAQGLTRRMSRLKLGLHEDEIVLSLVGTVCERKNQKILIEAISHLPSTLAPRIRVFIVGDRDSDYSKQLHIAIRNLPEEWNERIEVIDETDQPYLYFFAADVAICTSIRESYPRVVLEAMAFGLPLVTTSVYGIAEQAAENTNALFFPPHDAQALSIALKNIIEDNALRGSFSTNSKALFNGLMQYEDMLQRYTEIMQQATFSSPKVWGRS